MIAGTRCVVIGGGGHSKVLIATIEAAGGVVVRILDDNPGLHGQRQLGHVIDGLIADSNVPADAVAVMGIGSNSARAAVVARLSTRFGTVVHPAAVVHPSVTIGEGTVVFAGAVIQPDTRIGRHAIVNTGASVDHDCVLEDFVHVAPGAHLSGGVHLMQGAMMGVGSSAAPGMHIGARSVIGAGGAVVEAIPADVVAVGVPARVIRRLA